MVRFFTWLLVVFVAAHCVGCGQMEMKSADSTARYKSENEHAENNNSASEGWGNDFDSSKGSEAEPGQAVTCLLYTSPSPRDATLSRMPSSA